MPTSEANFDGLVGPTHNYAGLSYGNVASISHGGLVASPRAAALQGLSKMKALMDLGLVQGVLPPHPRPDVAALRRLGFSGSDDARVIEKAARTDPTLLAITSSASAMWTANAATVAPSSDTADGRVHFTVANLFEKAHRAIEPSQTLAILEATFPDRGRFVVHAPLPATPAFGDEGAANHTRLAQEASALGYHLFTFGRVGLDPAHAAPSRYPARQTLEASRAVARLHRLPEDRCLFVQQRPEVIDRGVFHNDVIAVGHERLMLRHEEAYVGADGALAALGANVEGFEDLVVPTAAVPVDDAVRSYLFNSQLVQPPGHDRPVLIAPEECRRVESVRRWLEAHVGPGRAIGGVFYFDLRESMHNGGGPACLRLRVVLSDEERAAVAPGALLDEARYEALALWVRTHYRDRLSQADLADPALLDECHAALDALTELLGLGSIYPFQRSLS